MPGRPTPTALKRLRGNPGKRRLDEHEPQPAPVTARRPPAWLRPDARKVWRALATELAAVGLFTKLDTFKVTVLAVALAEHQRAYETLQATIAAAAGTGVPADTWRLQRALRQQAETVKSLAGGFGMDPSDRVRLAVMPSALVDAFSEFDTPVLLEKMPVKH